jgi:hypothetical protein
MHVVAESAQETQIGLHRLLEGFFPVLILANQTVQCHIFSPPHIRTETPLAEDESGHASSHLHQ